MILFISCSCFPIGNTPSSSTSSSSSSIPGPMSSIKKWSIGFVGVVGILLLLAGTLQMGGGVYFILTLPVFSVASNIWTGVVTGLTGTVLTYFGCIQQTTRRTYILLTFCVVTLVANVANIIITQVGNNTLKLSLTKISDTEDDQTRLLAIEIGFWLTTGSTAFAILSSFVLANYLFCGQIKGKVHKALNPLDKTGSKERLENHTINKKTRFFPPSRIINAKVGCDEDLPNNSMWIPPNKSWLESRTNSLETSNNTNGGGTTNTECLTSSVNGGGLVNNAFGDSQKDIYNQCIEMNRFSKNNFSLELDLGTYTTGNSDNTSKFNTFRPKALYDKKNKSQLQTSNNVTKEATSTPKLAEVDEIPTYLQNHPDSWMFLLPSVFKEVMSPTVCDQSTSNGAENIEMKYGENSITDSKTKSDKMMRNVNEPNTNGGTTNSNTFNYDSNYQSSYICNEKINTKNPKTRPTSVSEAKKLKIQSKLKRPKEKPPSPPQMPSFDKIL